jgi:hypothetical protein
MVNIHSKCKEKLFLTLCSVIHICSDSFASTDSYLQQITSSKLSTQFANGPTRF